MSGPSHLSYTSTSSRGAVTSFDEHLLASRLTRDDFFNHFTFDSHSTPGASDASRDEPERSEFDEYLLEQDSILQSIINGATEAVETTTDNTHNVPSATSSTSANPSGSSSLLNRFESPVEASYWARWDAMPPQATSSQSCLGLHVAPPETQRLGGELIPGYGQRDTIPAAIQGNPLPRFTFPPSTEGEARLRGARWGHEEEYSSENTDRLATPALSITSLSSGFGSPWFPVTPLPDIRAVSNDCIDNPAKALVAPVPSDGEVETRGDRSDGAEVIQEEGCMPQGFDRLPPALASDTFESMVSSFPPFPMIPLEEIRRIRAGLAGGSFVTSIAPALLHQSDRKEENRIERMSNSNVPRDEEHSSEGTEKRGTYASTEAPEGAKVEVNDPEDAHTQIPEDRPVPIEEPAPVTLEHKETERAVGEKVKEEPVDLNLAPEAFARSPGAGQDDNANAAFAPLVAGPSRKRKNVIMPRTAPDLRQRSTLPPVRRSFRLRGAIGKAKREGKRRVKDLEVDAVSCTHLAGPSGLCHFWLPEEGRRCFVELPKDDKTARMHLNMHFDELGWSQRSEHDPNWMPTCHWCENKPTKFPQLMRHILDAHLLMFAEWCPCGGTISRANQKNNRGRHENSERHKAYLRALAEEKVKEEEEEAWSVDEDDPEDEQPAFVQGSSGGAKRRRLR